MKDAYIYDGSGWQSLKGPPGPSLVSEDAGNAISLGTDGYVYLAQPRVESIPVETTILVNDGGWTSLIVEGTMEVTERPERTGERIVRLVLAFPAVSNDTLVLLPTQSAAYAFNAYSTLMATAIFANDKDELEGDISRPPPPAAIRYIRETSLRQQSASFFYGDLFHVCVPEGITGTSTYVNHQIVLNILYEEDGA